MNDDDRKMIEEAEKLDAEAMPGPWKPWITDVHLDGDTKRFITRSRELLPALAKRLREALSTREANAGAVMMSAAVGCSQEEIDLAYATATKGRPSRSLEELLEAAKNLPEMTAEERVEQKVSWVFGQNALASPNHLSKGEVAGVVYKKAFEEVLADLRLAVRALTVIAQDLKAPDDIAGSVLARVKTKGL